MARRYSGPAIDVDDRTAEMTAQALQCRRYGGRHALMPALGSARRRKELELLGQAESVSRCVRECGFAKVELFDLHTGEVISVRTEYPKEGYLLKGGGRMPVTEARKALYARDPRMM